MAVRGPESAAARRDFDVEDDSGGGRQVPVFAVPDGPVDVTEGIPDTDVLRLVLAREAAIDCLEVMPARGDAVDVQSSWPRGRGHGLRPLPRA